LKFFIGDCFATLPGKCHAENLEKSQGVDMPVLRGRGFLRLI
jgi:hypothetical protein